MSSLPDVTRKSIDVNLSRMGGPFPSGRPFPELSSLPESLREDVRALLQRPFNAFDLSRERQQRASILDSSAAHDLIHRVYGSSGKKSAERPIEQERKRPVFNGPSM